MSRQVEKTQRFRNDLVESFNYLAERDVEVAKRFLRAAKLGCRSLAEMPGMGPRRGFRKPHLKEIRFWPISGFQNYLIFYVPIANGIKVLRVVHGARDIDQLFE